tara:strand:+ start:540 stop:872 length:333 start_codon:yes stop_codon:yes gene_type:complete
MSVSGLTSARGKIIDVETAAVDEVFVMRATMGTLLAGGFSVLASGTGRGTIKVYYVKADGNRVPDAFISGEKDSALLIANYGGYIPELEISITPDAATAYTFHIEVCGVN